MKTLLAFLFYLSIPWIAIKAQVIPDDLLGDWTAIHHSDGCGIPIQDENLQIVISDFGSSPELDTVEIVFIFSTDSIVNEVYYLDYNQSDPTLIDINRVDTLNGDWNYFQFIDPDSLIFGWLSACNACFCGGTYELKPTGFTNVELLDFEELNWNVFPNPFINKVTIAPPTKGGTVEVQVQLFDHKGKIVRPSRFSQTGHSIDLSYLPVGVYFLRINYNQRTYTKRLLKLDHS